MFISKYIVSLIARSKWGNIMICYHSIIKSMDDTLTCLEPWMKKQKLSSFCVVNAFSVCLQFNVFYSIQPNSMFDASIIQLSVWEHSTAIIHTFIATTYCYLYYILIR